MQTCFKLDESGKITKQKTPTNMAFTALENVKICGNKINELMKVILRPRTTL